jgi:hypothetical protein
MLLHLQNIKDSSAGTDKIWCFSSHRPEKIILQLKKRPVKTSILRTPWSPDSPHIFVSNRKVDLVSV